MLSIEQCRALLPPSCSLSNEDLQRVRDQLYAVARVAVDLRARGAALGPKGEFDEAAALIPESALDEVEERAAIYEFDAGLRRSVAERRAVSELIGEMRSPRKTHHPGR
jgi:hypothetical protein